MRQRRAETEPNPAVFSRSEAVNRALTSLFGVCAALFFILAVTGTVRNYSPVPWLDMWDDYIGFYLKIHAGDWSAWWVPHNEHRIVLARLFFWIDIACFHGNGIFALAVIYVFVLAVGLVFAEIWREQSQGQDLYILFFVEAWIFSWMQQENLTWGFQSQFILAQLLPLAGLYFLHLSLSKSDRARFYFGLATLCGVLAVGSMANGVLALPAMAFYAVVAARSLRRAAFFLALSAVEIYAYFYHLTRSHFTGAAPSFAGEIFQHPGGFIEFFLNYLGGPFITLIGFKKPGAIYFGELLAAALVLSSVFAFYTNWRKAQRASLPLALLVFIFYIMATAAITAAGRLPFGTQEALASRYQTPALYGWSAALLLFWPAIAKSSRFKNVFCLFLAGLLCFVMLPRQLLALTGQREVQYQKELGALALELQIYDADRIQMLYPLPGVALDIAKGARQQHLSVFGFPPLEDAHLLLGQKMKTEVSNQCQGNLESFTVIPGTPQYVHVEGWLYNARRITAPELVILADRTNEIVGVGLLGEQRIDVAHLLGRKALFSGFEGYLSATASREPISVLSPGNGCELPPMIARSN